MGPANDPRTRQGEQRGAPQLSGTWRGRIVRNRHHGCGSGGAHAMAAAASYRVDHGRRRPAAWHLILRTWRSSWQAGVRTRLSVGTAYGVVLLAFAGALSMAMTKDTRAKARYRIENPAVVPASMQEEGAGPAQSVFSVLRRHERSRDHSRQFFHDERDLRPVSYRDLQGMAVLRPPLLVFQQSVVPQVDRVHAGCRRDDTLEVVRRVPRSRRVLQWPLRPSHQGTD